MRFIVESIEDLDKYLSRYYAEEAGFVGIRCKLYKEKYPQRAYYYGNFYVDKNSFSITVPVVEAGRDVFKKSSITLHSNHPYDFAEYSWAYTKVWGYEKPVWTIVRNGKFIMEAKGTAETIASILVKLDAGVKEIIDHS